MTEPRIPPLPVAEWDGAVREALSRAGMSKVPDERLPAGITSLLRHPGLAGPFLAFNGVMLWEPVLDPRHRELAVLRVAWLAGCPYEWLQHVRMAGRYGVVPEEMRAVTEGPGAPGWAPLEAALLSATDQLVAQHSVDDATWSVLAAGLEERQLIEFVFVVGTYAALAMVFNALGLQPEPELLTGPAADLPVPRIRVGSPETAP